MKVRDATHNLRELSDIHEQATGRELQKPTYYSETVRLWVGLCKLDHISIVHPPREDAEERRICRHGKPQQRQDVWMGYISPTNYLSAEPLDEPHNVERRVCM